MANIASSPIKNSPIKNMVFPPLHLFDARIRKNLSEKFPRVAFQAPGTLL